MNVKEILHRPPPPILYHYTTQQGLLGIINNQEIWATHTQYLNDSREFCHATELMREEVSAMEKEPRVPEASREDLATMHEWLSGGSESVNVCVCSFSQNGNAVIFCPVCLSSPEKA
jgi:hypothetical protein